MSSLAVLDTAAKEQRQQQGQQQQQQGQRGERSRRIRTTTVPPPAAHNATASTSRQSRPRTLSASHTATTHSHHHHESALQEPPQHGATALRKAYSLSSLSSSHRRPVYVFPAFSWQVNSGSSSPAVPASASDDLDKQQQLKDERQKLLPELLGRVEPKPSCLKRTASAPQLNGQSPPTSPETSPCEPAHEHSQQRQEHQQKQQDSRQQTQAGQEHASVAGKVDAEVGMDDTGSFPASPSAPIELSGHVAQAIDNLPPDHVTRRELRRHSTEILSAPDVSKIMLVSPRRRQRTRRLRWRDETGQRLCSSIYFDKTQPACECSLNPPAVLRSSNSASPSQPGAGSTPSPQAPSSPRPPRSVLLSRSSPTPYSSSGRDTADRSHTLSARSWRSSPSSSSLAHSSLLSSASPPSSWAQAWQSPYVGGSASAYSTSRLGKNSSNNKSSSSGYSTSTSTSEATSGGDGTEYRPCKTIFTFVDAHKLPHNRVEMLQALGKKCVQLEELTIRAPHLFFTIRVFNVAFEKAVIIRYTTDGWKTNNDVHAHYLPGTSEPSTDRFYANLSLPLFSKDQSVQFAICYRSQGKEFWDNNDGVNYTVSVTRVPFMRFGSSPSPSPPSSRKASATDPSTPV